MRSEHWCEPVDLFRPFGLDPHFVEQPEQFGAVAFTAALGLVKSMRNDALGHHGEGCAGLIGAAAANAEHAVRAPRDEMKPARGWIVVDEKIIPVGGVAIVCADEAFHGPVTIKLVKVDDGFETLKQFFIRNCGRLHQSVQITSVIFLFVRLNVKRSRQRLGEITDRTLIKITARFFEVPFQERFSHRLDITVYAEIFTVHRDPSEVATRRGDARFSEHEVHDIAICCTVQCTLLDHNVLDIPLCCNVKCPFLDHDGLVILFCCTVNCTFFF